MKVLQSALLVGVGSVLSFFAGGCDSEGAQDSGVRRDTGVSTDRPNVADVPTPIVMDVPDFDVMAADVPTPRGPAPRPIAPSSLSDVTSFRPTFRWELRDELDGAVIELCRDRACTMVIETIRMQGTSARPMNPLSPRSVVYWRMRATVGAVIQPSYSPTWLFHVPAAEVAGGVDRSGYPHLDLNGDGFDDVVVGARNARAGGRVGGGSVSVYYGTAMGLSMAPGRVIEGPGGSESFGWSAAGAGDLDGDGFGDLLVGAPGPDAGNSSRAGAVSVFHGGPAGIGMMPSLVITGTDRSRFGVSVSSAGDVNGDGYADVVVGALFAAPGGRASAGTASIFHGAMTGLSMMPARVLEGVMEGDQFGASVAGAGDVNGDGFSDVIVGAHRASPDGRMNAGSASIYHGSAMGVAMAPARVLDGVAAVDWFGGSVAGAGDLNSDGFGDVVIGAFNTTLAARMNIGTATVYHGSAMGIGPMPTRTLVGVAAGDNFGYSVANAGDVNGDGFYDLIVGASAADPGGRADVGSASVFFGSAMSVAMAANITLEGVAAGGSFGRSASGAGDINGDGYSDVIVGAFLASPNMRNNAGAASLFNGSATGPAMAPTRVLEGASAGDLFGWSVARLEVRRGRNRNRG